MYDYDCVVLSKDGLWRNKWNQDTREYEKIVPEEVTVFSLLRNACVIAEGTTLLDIMNIVEGNELLTMFLGQYSWCRDIDAFHAQVNEPQRTIHFDDDGNEIDDPEEMVALEILWHTTYHPDGKFPDFSIEPEFHGLGPEPEAGERRNTYSVSYGPVYDIADLPVVLNKHFTVYKPWEPNKTADDRIIMEGEKDFTLLEVLDAIYWDISFAGGPDDNAAFLEEMKGRVDEIESCLASGVPLEDFTEPWLDLTDEDIDFGDEEEADQK